jgi:hypothetical protein
MKQLRGLYAQTFFTFRTTLVEDMFCMQIYKALCVCFVYILVYELCVCVLCMYWYMCVCFVYVLVYVCVFTCIYTCVP